MKKAAGRVFPHFDSYNGRILGYDSSHGHHHRHFRGEVEEIAYSGYEALGLRFRQEVEELWRQEDESR